MTCRGLSCLVAAFSFFGGNAGIKAIAHTILVQLQIRHIKNYIKLPWLTIFFHYQACYGGFLCGKAQRLFIPTAPGLKGASSSQAQTFCYANTVSQISCLLHRQTQALPWELERSRHSTVHLSAPLHPTPTGHAQKHTHVQTWLHHFRKWKTSGVNLCPKRYAFVSVENNKITKLCILKSIKIE